MARRKTTGAATGGAEPAEPRGQRAELEESTEANLADARQRVRLR
ncbi:MAG TPA: hypothetical protein VJ140_08930 [Actinomycetota bacterium]|nr:hypothetical protein [Actinomycetota bacterium]